MALVVVVVVVESEPTKTDASISHVPFILFFTLPQDRDSLPPVFWGCCKYKMGSGH